MQNRGDWEEGKEWKNRARRGICGPRRLDCPGIAVLRISHFPTVRFPFLPPRRCGKREWPHSFLSDYPHASARSGESSPKFERRFRLWAEIRILADEPPLRTCSESES